MSYLLIVLLLIGSAFFSGTEIAYTSLSKLKVKKEGIHAEYDQKLTDAYNSIKSKKKVAK